MHRIWLLLALATFLFPAALSAQVGIYAGFSENKLEVSNTDWNKGAIFGAYYDASHFPVLNFGVDLRGTVLDGNYSNGSYTHVRGGMFGPRVVAHLPIVPLHPYVEGLVGATHVEMGPSFATDATHLSYGVATGLDFTFFPRLDWRVVDYQFGRINGFYGSAVSQHTITTGLVFRLPIP